MIYDGVEEEVEELVVVVVVGGGVPKSMELGPELTTCVMYHSCKYHTFSSPVSKICLSSHITQYSLSE